MERQAVVAPMSWATHVLLQWSVQEAKAKRDVDKSQKADLSADWSLKPDSMKLKSLVIAYQHDAVIRPGPCTHRPSHHPSWGYTKVIANRKEDSAEGMPGEGGEVVTR